MENLHAGQVERADSLETKFDHSHNSAAQNHPDRGPPGSPPIGQCQRPNPSGSASARTAEQMLLAAGRATRREAIDRSPDAEAAFKTASQSLFRYATAIFRAVGDVDRTHLAEETVQRTWERFFDLGLAGRFDRTAYTLQMPLLLKILRNVAHEVRRLNKRSVSSHLAGRASARRDGRSDVSDFVLYVGGQAVAVARRTRDGDHLEVAAAGPEPWQAAAAAEEAAAVRAAVDALSPALAEAVREAFWGVSEHPPTTVTHHVRLHRARQRLRRSLASLAGR